MRLLAFHKSLTVEYSLKLASDYFAVIMSCELTPHGVASSSPGRSDESCDHIDTAAPVRVRPYRLMRSTTERTAQRNVEHGRTIEKPLNRHVGKDGHMVRRTS